MNIIREFTTFDSSRGRLRIVPGKDVRFLNVDVTPEARLLIRDPQRLPAPLRFAELTCNTATEPVEVVVAPFALRPGAWEPSERRESGPLPLRLEEGVVYSVAPYTMEHVVNKARSRGASFLVRDGALVPFREAFHPQEAAGAQLLAARAGARDEWSAECASPDGSDWLRLTLRERTRDALSLAAPHGLRPERITFRPIAAAIRRDGTLVDLAVIPRETVVDFVRGAGPKAAPGLRVRLDILSGSAPPTPKGAAATAGSVELVPWCYYILLIEGSTPVRTPAAGAGRFVAVPNILFATPEGAYWLYEPSPPRALRHGR